MSNAERIRAALDRSPAPLDMSPGTTYEAMTRAKVDDLENDVRELRGRVDTFLWLIIGTVLVNIVLQIGGF